MGRTVYLDTLTVEEAYAALSEAYDLEASRRIETVPVSESLGRITSEAVFAKVSNPHYNASAMDGIAVRSEDLVGVDERNPRSLKLNDDFTVVDTGDVIPEGFDSVVMVEDVLFITPEEAQIQEATYPYEHVRVVGEDVVIGEMILPTRHRIRPMDIGALLAGGIETLQVYAKPKVALIPTGTEIVVPGTPLKPGDIIDSNSYVFAALTTEAGGVSKTYGPIPDERELLKNTLLTAVAENDLVVINAGSSAGREDFTAGLVEELGTLIVHGLSIKPGRPTILGVISGKPVIGVPGYPVSAYVVFQAFVEPLIKRMAAIPAEQEVVVDAKLSKRIVSSLKHEEYVRMKLGKVGDAWVATPLNRGAGTTMSLVQADALLTIPRHSEGYEAGAVVPLTLWKPLEALSHTLVTIGSHDILLDHIQDAMIRSGAPLRISSAHVGSLGGVMAVKRGETHLAPIHLLDSESGQYNGPAIAKYLKGQPMLLIKGIKRRQGLYLKAGNPAKITGLKDIADRRLIFANRQKGSGTRLLLDHLLQKEGIAPSAIKGYEQELLTHTAVALAVQSGNADAGVGIESVAKLMGLAFQFIGEEDYDFLVPEALFETPEVQHFLEHLKSEGFRAQLNGLGGYRLEPITIQRFV